MINAVFRWTVFWREPDGEHYQEAVAGNSNGAGEFQTRKHAEDFAAEVAKIRGVTEVRVVFREVTE